MLWERERKEPTVAACPEGKHRRLQSHNEHFELGRRGTSESELSLGLKSGFARENGWRLGRDGFPGRGKRACRQEGARGAEGEERGQRGQLSLEKGSGG